VSTYRAVAQREGRLWVVDVEGVGTTQGRNLMEAKEMAGDLVVAVLDVGAQHVTIDFRVALDDDLSARVDEARRLTADAEVAQRRAAELTRSVVLALRERGLTGKDLAAVLNVSEQRASQLLARARAQASSGQPDTHHAAVS
jgi:DNA-directed RNA polymerase specialized sigma24 family protein